jgi:mannose-6-phosphate isomerase-like protein (cupin superfamily)
MRSAAFFSMVLVVACGGSKQPASSSSSGGGSSTTSAAATSDKPATGDAPTSDAPATGDAPKAAAADKMDAALPETKDTKPFPRRAECAGKGCNWATIVPDTLKGQVDKDAPIFFFEVVMPPKVMMLLPKHSGLDLYAVLLDGEVSVLADDIKEKQKRAWKLNGFRAPGVGINIYSKEPTRMIFAVVVAGTSGTVAEQLDKVKASTWTKRSSPVTAFELSSKPDLAWNGGAYHARLAYEQGSEGSPPASLSWLAMSKNAAVPEHAHDKEWEFLVLVDGDGELVRKSGGNTPIASGTFTSIKPGVPHSFKPAGGKPTYAIQMYWPAGPEQRFKKMATENK